MIWCMVYCVDVCIVVLTLTFLFLWRLCSFQIWLRGNDGYAVVWKKTSRSTRLQVLYVTRALVYGSRTSGASNTFFFFAHWWKLFVAWHLLIYNPTRRSRIIMYFFIWLIHQQILYIKKHWQHNWEDGDECPPLVSITVQQLLWANFLHLYFSVHYLSVITYYHY